MTEPDAARPSLYDAVGGLPGLRALSSAFYEKVLPDPVLAPVFAHFTPTHVDHIAVWLGEVFGGPAGYTDGLGGHHALLDAHLGLHITEEQRVRWMELMAETVAELLPPDEELRTAVLQYFDWGTRIAKDVSADPPGTDLGEPGPTPRWGWHGLA